MRNSSVALLLTSVLFSPFTFAVSSPLAFSAEQPAVFKQTSQAFNRAAKNATPAVVSIQAIKLTEPLPTQLLPWLDPEQSALPAPPNGPQLGMGSGVIIDEKGLILTNNHVVSDAQNLQVILNGNELKKYDAKVIGTDTRTDIAVIQLLNPPKNLVKIDFADSNQVEVGDWVIAIGSPFGLTHSVTSGIISAKGRMRLGVYDIEDFIQTDAAINPGNSGGPLLNLDGKMVGLNAAIFSQTGGYMGIGFSISANLARKVANEIISHGKVTRGYLGIAAQDIDPDLAQYFRSGSPQGALVSSVDPSGPAGHANTIETGDVIRKFNSTPVKDATALRDAVNQSKVGSQANAELVRNGKTRTVTLTIGESPEAENRINSPKQLAGQAAAETKNGPFGLELNDPPAELLPLIGIPEGVGALITGVVPGSSAFEAGLAPGDVILKSGDHNVKGAKSLQKFMNKMKAHELAVLYVQRGPKHQMYVPLRAR